MDYLAAKVLLKSLALDKVFLRLFRREAKSLDKLQHCSIVRYYGLFQQGKTAFILLDDIEGMTDAATATMVGFGTPAYMAPELVRGSETPRRRAISTRWGWCCMRW